MQTAGIVVEPSTAFTILAPTNFAFADRLNKTFNITPADLLKPESKEKLQTVLGYHIITSGAVKSSQLRDCLTVATALRDPNNATANLTVRVRKGKVDFEGPTNDARVITADISAGESVIHILDDVLLPPGVGAKAVAPSFPSLAAVLQGANLTILAAAVQPTNNTILAPSDFAFH
uniref:FAS1 domain-containing protein n=1 Tax=Tetradesmus obliquus TaxID=3088 RepID=A0A383VJS1_TETOB|eukprot:jgi/Sobl393_1/14156/SZX65778.1